MLFQRYEVDGDDRMSALLSSLRQRFGDAAIRDGMDNALGVVAPDRADAMAELLAFCSDEAVPVQIAGGGTWLQPPRMPGPNRLIVSTARLIGTTEYNPGDLVVGARAGTELDLLEATLRKQRQTLPLDPPAMPGATVGATVALNAAGPLRAAHGTPRDMVLGLEVVTGDGRLLRFGGRVVKNVAGYDVVRLLTGSHGTLAVITALYMRVRGEPEADVTLVAGYGGAVEAAQAALAVRDILTPDALEVDFAGTWHVRIRLRGGPVAVADAVSRVQAAGPFRPDNAAGNVGTEVTAGTAAAAGDQSAWPADGDGEASAALHVEVRGRPADLPALLTTAHSYSESISRSTNGLHVRLGAHATAGTVRIWLPQASATPDPEVFRRASTEFVESAVTNGWTWRYNVVPPALTDATPADSGPDERAAVIMSQIRRSFDPAGTLQPAAPVLP